MVSVPLSSITCGLLAHSSATVKSETAGAVGSTHPRFWLSARSVEIVGVTPTVQVRVICTGVASSPQEPV